MKKPLPVIKVVYEYSAEELLKFREQFREQSALVWQRNRKSRLCGAIVCMAILFPLYLILALIFLAATFHYDLKQNFPKVWNWIGFILLFEIWSMLFVLPAVAYFLLIRPWSWFKCPACHNSIYLSRLGHYCPACGSNQLEAGNFWGRLPKCNGCGKKLLLMHRSRRNYKVRVCTHCGVLLDEKGF
jgi:hypothetical protein